MDDQQDGIGWNSKRIQNEVAASHYNDGRSKSHVGFVNPMHFLHATTPDNQHLAQIVNQAGQLDKEKLSKEGQSPFFRVDDGKIVAHEGRHRMSALARQGYTSVPVAVHYGQGAKLNPAGSVTLQPQFKGRDPVTVSNLIPLHHDYDDQINDMMKQQPEHFQDGGDVERFHGTDVHNLQKFDPSTSRTAKYHYLADEPETAGAYGKHVYRVRLKPKNIISFHPENIGPKQMKVVHELSERLGENPDHLLHAITSADGSFYGTRGSLQDRVMDELKDMGHDAVRFPDVAPGGGWDMSTVVLDNSIIHSIDKHDPAIGKEGGGPVEQDGITAYHGSPHDFEQFDTSKIGTGEGAQAYGHGLYFASHEPVAQEYRNRLSYHNLPPLEIDGERFHQPTTMQKQVEFHSGDVDAVLKKMAPNWERAISAHASMPHDANELERMLAEDDAKQAHKERAEVEGMRGKTVKYGKPGRMYEVHINAHPHHFLDWDKPLSEQSEHVRNVMIPRLAKFKELGANFGNDPFGSELHRAAHPTVQLDDVDWERGPKAQASDWLLKHGIKGIKYLDAGSRGDRAEPTHNYVVFDHNDVRVKRKYERGGRVDYNTGGPVNVSKAEDTAGNFKKEHEKIHGIPVAIEVKEGHDRVKYEPNGDLKFKAKQYADYGAILGTKDADGMNTDVMVGPHKDSEKAYIIDQRKHDSGKFDEHKVMLGFNKRKKAIKAYTKSYADRHGKERVQDVVKTDIKGLKKWLKHGNLDKPASKDALIMSALSVVSKKT